MSKLRYILFPFALLYALVTEVRNFLFDTKIFKSTAFDVPIINVGNLRVGGTGKTPMIEYLIRLLQPEFKVAVVSRGYKRKTKGIVLADAQSTASSIGDEPFQIYQKFPDITMVVGANRVVAVQHLLQIQKPDVILLDDAFQHRWIDAGFNILLTAYNQVFSKDFILPVGDLRECRKSARRADVVVVSKIPDTPSFDREKVVHSIQKYTSKPVFFSKIVYDDYIYSNDNRLKISEITDYKILLVTGIAVMQPLLSFIKEKNINFVNLSFGDHHRYNQADVKRIQGAFSRIQAENKLILTTEKDFVRLHPSLNQDLYYLPIRAEVIENELFNNKILAYVRTKK